MTSFQLQMHLGVVLALPDDWPRLLTCQRWVMLLWNCRRLNITAIRWRSDLLMLLDDGLSLMMQMLRLLQWGRLLVVDPFNFYQLLGFLLVLRSRCSILQKCLWRFFVTFAVFVVVVSLWSVMAHWILVSIAGNRRTSTLKRWWMLHFQAHRFLASHLCQWLILRL